MRYFDVIVPFDVLSNFCMYCLIHKAGMKSFLIATHSSARLNQVRWVIQATCFGENWAEDAKSLGITVAAWDEKRADDFRKHLNREWSDGLAAY